MCQLIGFFKGTGTDIECRSLDEILAWNDTLMEVCHDYIQWLFPIDEASGFNSDAPILTEELQRAFCDDQEMRSNFKRGLARFTQFLGLLLEESSEGPSITKADNFDKRVTMCWRGPRNHNWRRMTRVLRCLRLLEMRKEQRAFFACLEQIILELPGKIGQAAAISDEAIIHWRGEVDCTISPGFAAAVLGSPNLLAALCQQYFAKYDTNSNGFIEISEAVVLVRQLHVGLGLSAELLDEQQVANSMKQFTRADSRDALDAEEFNEFFSSQLRDALDQSEKQQTQAATTAAEAAQEAPLEVINASYAKALLASSTLLERLCKIYFKTFDVNHNGVLDLSEAIALARELHQGLGMPADTLDEWQLLSSCESFQQSDEWAGLTADEFPSWFAGALRGSLEKSSTEGMGVRKASSIY